MNPMEARILDELRTAVDGRGLISSSEELKTYECDGLTNFRVQPRAVLLPTCTEQVQAIVRICHRERIPFVARGSGTGLSGGALPVESGIVIGLARMRSEEHTSELHSPCNLVCRLLLEKKKINRFYAFLVKTPQTYQNLFLD